MALPRLCDVGIQCHQLHDRTNLDAANLHICVDVQTFLPHFVLVMVHSLFTQDFILFSYIGAACFLYFEKTKEVTPHTEVMYF